MAFTRPSLTRAAVAGLTVVGASAALTACAVEDDANTADSTAASRTAASSAVKEGDDKGGDDALEIVASTGYLADVVANVAPEAEITTLVKPGGDPHTQELSTSDIQAVDEADLVVWTSHDMEHRMMDHFDELGDKQIPAAEAIPEQDLLPWEEDGKVEGHDPHVWNSPENWQYVVTAVGDKLAEVDPDNAADYEANAKKYNDEISELTDWATEQLAGIPDGQRVLVTGHDAFNYLGDSFDLEVYATDLVSTESEISPVELNELAEMIVEKKVPAIFADTTKNPAVVEQLQEAVKSKGGEVKISDEVLYADTLSDTAPEDTYIGAFRHNVEAIAAALAK